MKDKVFIPPLPLILDSLKEGIEGGNRRREQKEGIEGGNRRATAKTEDLNNYLKFHPRPGHDSPEGE